MRLFLAAPIPIEQQSMIAALQEEMRSSIPRASWVKAAGSHVTIRFFGDYPDLNLLKSKLRILEGFKPIKVDLGLISAFPNQSRPKVIWLGVSGLEPIASLVDSALEEQRDHPFQGHITLCRLNKPLKKEIWDNSTIGQFLVNELILYESELSSSGAIHTPVAKFRLGG